LNIEVGKGELSVSPTKRGRRHLRFQVIVKKKRGRPNLPVRTQNGPKKRKGKQL